MSFRGRRPRNLLFAPYEKQIPRFARNDKIRIIRDALESYSADAVRLVDDASEREIYFLPVLAGELYAPLRDPAVFNQVRLDTEVHTLVWPNAADFDPAMLHDWPQHAQALAACAQEWERAAA